MYTIENLGPVASEAVVANRYRLRAGAWSVRNDQSAPGKTYPVRIGQSGEERLPLPLGHTAGLALRIDADGSVYGWSMGRVGGKARYHAVVWAVGKPLRIVDSQDSEAIGPADWLEDGVVIHRKRMNGQQGALFVVRDAGPLSLISEGAVPGVVSVAGGAAGAILSGADLRPCLWLDGVQLPLSAPPAGESALATCAAPGVAFGYRSVGASQFAVGWDLVAGGMVDIPSPPGLVLRSVLGCYEGGIVEGVANDAEGRIVAWRGVPA